MKDFGLSIFRKRQDIYTEDLEQNGIVMITIPTISMKVWKTNQRDTHLINVMKRINYQQMQYQYQ